MVNRFLSVAAAVGPLVLASLSPQQASALPGVGAVEPQAGPALVQQAGSKSYRRYDPHTGTYVRAPFTEVDARRMHLGRRPVCASLFGPARHLGAGAVREPLGSALAD
jgi:hypothetical protein